MRFRFLVPLTSLIGALFVTVAAEQAKPAASTPATDRPVMSLFDGKSLTGWRGYKKADASGSRWAAQDGLLTLSPNDGKDTRGERDIITVETFDLFDLSWDWKIAEGGNSGLKYFVLEDRDSAIGHEYQMIDDRAASRRQDRTASADGRLLRRARGAGDSPRQTGG